MTKKTAKSNESLKIKKPKKVKEFDQKFEIGDYAFYPSHGVGKIINIEKINISEEEHIFYIMYFEKEKLTIKIPASRSDKIGLRSLISKTEMEEVFNILRSGIKKVKGMWSRRAQEYEAKINSGNITLLAEVLRDLTRDIEDGDRSYSERIIYETAVNRLALEYSIIENIKFEEAKEIIIATARDKIDSTDSEIRKKDKDFDDEFDEFDLEEDEEEEEDDFDFDFDDEEDGKKSRKKNK